MDIRGKPAGTELTRRTQSAYQAIFKLKRTTFTKDVPLQLRTSLFHLSVRSVLLYGTDTWGTSSAKLGRLLTTDSTLLRKLIPNSFYKLTDVLWVPISNSALYSRAAIPRPETTIFQSRWNLFMRVLRSPSLRCRQVHLDCAKEGRGRRKVGRPLTTWHRTILLDAPTRGFSVPGWNSLCCTVRRLFPT